MSTHRTHICTRRHFLRLGAGAALVILPLNRKGTVFAGGGEAAPPVVSIAKVRNGDIPAAVEEAIDLLGGIAQVTAGKQRMLLKPNLVNENTAATTKPAVIRALARLMLDAGKEVLIGEGSAVATGFNWLDMAQVNKLGLTVIDASTAMQGEGPTDGTLLAMNLIVAGTSPLATDMVGARLMGFTDLEAIPQFAWAHKLGMRPATLEDIEVRGEKIADVQRRFGRPTLFQWTQYSPEIYPTPKPKIEVGPDQKAVITWDDNAPLPRPQVEYTADDKAYLTWTNQAAGPPAYVERSLRVNATSWGRLPLSSPGRAEFDMKRATNQFFRLRKQD